MTRVALVLLAALAVVGVARGGPSPTASKPPASLRAGEPWTVTVRPGQPAGTRFEIRLGRTVKTFAVQRTRTTVTFPRPGRWTYGLRTGLRFQKLGSAVVRQRRLFLSEPFDAIEAGPWIVVTDRRAGAVYRLHRTTGRWARVAAVTEARELEPVDADTVLVTSGVRVLRLDLRNGDTTEVARAADVILGLAVDGASTYASEGDEIVRLLPSGRRVVASGLDGVHGVLVRDGKLLAAESFGGRVLEIDPTSGDVTALARGLANPSALARAGDGRLYVSEFVGGRVGLLTSDGRVRTIASVPQAGALWLAADGSLLVTTLGGDVVRLDPRSGRSRSVLD